VQICYKVYEFRLTTLRNTWRLYVP